VNAWIVLILLTPWLAFGISYLIYDWLEGRDRRSLEREAVSRFDAEVLKLRSENRLDKNFRPLP
jgi:hypothetical protein